MAGKIYLGCDFLYLETQPFQRMENQDINAIIYGLRQRDHVIIGELLDAYGAALYNVILRIVQSHELAEEVLQETFVKVWKAGENYDVNKGQLFTWLLNIARNTAIDATRTGHFQRLRFTETISDSNYQPEILYTQLDYLDLSTHLKGLAEKYRVLIELTYFKGYTQDEISKELNIPLGTVKTRLYIAIEKLRKIYPKGLSDSVDQTRRGEKN